MVMLTSGLAFSQSAWASSVALAAASSSELSKAKYTEFELGFCGASDTAAVVGAGAGSGAGSYLAQPTNSMPMVMTAIASFMERSDFI